MTIYNAYLLKGYLSDKKAPKRIMEALDNLIGHLHAVEGKQRPAAPAPGPAETGPDSPDEEDDPECAAHIGPPTGGHQLAQEAVPRTPPEGSIAADHSVPPSPQMIGSDASAKKKRNFSPEARAAAAERMRAMQARKKEEREASTLLTPEQSASEPRKAEPPTPAKTSPAPKPKPLPAIDHERLITVHKGYAGKRDPGQPLTDDDWPDIKARLAKSPDRRAIASDYDVDLEDLNFFIASCQRREGKSPGEAVASPSSGASGAARPKW